FPVILEFFLEDAAKYVDQIVDGLASNDVEAVAAAAHPLKSSSHEMGATELSELAKNIEEGALTATNDNGGLASIGQFAEHLPASFEEVKAELEAIIAQDGVSKKSPETRLRA
ncbi:MAG: Hpt domain-containing protein, partial [Alphaproteobacteria bacterium]|nr:Hpt domain-containing protein [Alphaproteobacteria bacterium]